MLAEVAWAALPPENSMFHFDLMTRTAFAVVSLALALVSGALLVYAAVQVWNVISHPEGDVGTGLLQAVGFIVISLAVFEVSKYLVEEEVISPTERRVPGEARRALTKFMSTIAIAVFLEALVLVFAAGKEDISQILYPTLLFFAGIALVVGLGVYQRLSVTAEVDTVGIPDEPAPEDTAGPTAGTNPRPIKDSAK